MKEYLTQAIVLRVSPRGEFDRFLDLYTKVLGRVGARVIGGRRILSKLSPHLQDLTLINVRLVKKGGFTVTDALEQDRFLSLKKNPRDFVKAQDLIFLIRELVPKAAPDLRLWHEVARALQTDNWNFRVFLKLLGYDPAGAACEICGAKKVAAFYPGDQSFLCFKCSGKFPKNKLVLMD